MLRMDPKMNTNTGLVAVTVDTSDTGPKLMAVTFSTTANGANMNSAKANTTNVCLLPRAVYSWRKAPGLHKNMKTVAIP